MAVLQDININVHGQPSEKRLQTFLRLSQNENGRMINFRVLGPPLPSNCTATFSGTKPDGNVYSKTGTVTGNFVVIEEDMQMTAVAGVWDAKLDIINGAHNIMTALIRVVVDADVVDPDAIASDSQLQGLVAEAKYYAEHARTDAYGSPLTAPTKAQMTDRTRVYVYTGSEPNMIAGNWYHWNGTAWISGGVYNAVAVQTDTTLSVAGKAADGKATGDALNALKEDLKQLFTGVEILDDTIAARGTNSDVTNNNDGTYTIGTTDYGNTAFGSAITLKAGCTYYLYGVPQGISYLFPSTSSASESYNNRIFENTGSIPKRFYTDTDVTVYVGYRIAAKPNEAITIRPSLIRFIPVERYFKHNIAFFGDSIMWGQDGAESAHTQTPWPIPDTVSNILGVSVKNYGVRGQGYTPTTGSPTPAYGTISNVDLSDFDTVVLSYGINDGFSELGSWDSDDENTIMGQFHKIVNYIYTQSPTMRIIVFAPINGKNIGTFPDYWYGPRDHQLGYVSRRILSDTLKQACDYYWIPFIEMYDGPINPNNISLFLPDGIHPSNACYKQLGEWYAAKIRGVM